MKSIKTILAIASATLILTSCGGSGNIIDDVEYLPVKTDRGGDWGFIGPDGELLFDDEFKSEPTAVVNGYFTVREDDGYAVYKADKKPVPVKGLADLKRVGCVNNGMIGIVRPDERIAFVDTDGNTRFTLDPVGGKEITSATSVFTDGLAIFHTEDGKAGAFDTKGNIVIQPKYDEMSSFNEGYAFAVVNGDDASDEADSRTFIINKDGEQIVSLRDKYKIMRSEIRHGVAPAYESVDGDKRYGFINTKGEFTKLPSKVHGIGYYNDDILVFQNDDMDYGVMKRDGEVVIRAKYDELVPLMDGVKFLAENDDKYSILDAEGTKLLSLEYDDVEPILCNDFKLIAKDADDMMLIDFEGKQIGKATFARVGYSILEDYTLYSDYFNYENVAAAIANLVGSKSIAGVSLGEAPSKYLTDARDASYTSVFSPKEIEGGFNYNLTLSAYCNDYIARGEYDSYNYEYRYFFNPASTISNLTLTCSTYRDNLWKDIRQPLVRALESKGFRKTSETSQEILMQTGNVALKLATDYSESDLTLEIYFSQSDVVAR